MKMTQLSFDASDSLDEHLPSDATVVSVHYAGDTETVEYVVDDDEFTCDECGESFDSRQALAGHNNAH